MPPEEVKIYWQKKTKKAASSCQAHFKGALVSE